MKKKASLAACISVVLIAGIIALIRPSREVGLPILPGKYRSSTLAALARSGGNRGELARALCQISRERLPSMCDMISRIPQYDLLNIKAGMLLDSVNSAFETNVRVPWKLDPDSEVFLDYVLPYRVANESLENSRREIRDSYLPLLQGCRSAREAVRRVLTFAIAVVPKDEDRLGSAFPYDWAPCASLRHGQLRDALGCRAQSLFEVAALRAVGIAAREIDEMTTQRELSGHVNIMYFDPGEKKWHPILPDGMGETPDRQFAVWEKNNGQVAVYTLPPYMKNDVIGKQLFDQLTNTGTFSYPSGRLVVSASYKGHAVADARVCVYIWRHKVGGWYPVALSRTDDKGEAELLLGDNTRWSPYMVSAGKGDDIAYSFVRVRSGQPNRVAFDLAQPPQEQTVDIREPGRR